MKSLELIHKWRKEGKKLVFTNGCFDLLHPGHVQYLTDAAKLADHLIVGLNSDESVSRLKGPSRPINDVVFRQRMLESLKPVDLVLVFEEDTPIQLITHVRPDIIVKGGDYSIDEVVGGDLVVANGGEVRILPFLQGYSSTSMIKRIKDIEL